MGRRRGAWRPPGCGWRWATSPTASRCAHPCSAAAGGDIARATLAAREADARWSITKLNDQHAYLRGSGPEHQALRVGDLVVLGISHPCTTFDKWRWMPVVDESGRVVDAITMQF